MHTDTYAAGKPRHLVAERAVPAILSDRLVPAIEAARDYLSSSKSNTEKLIAAGELRVIRLGRKRMIRESEIARFIAAAEQRTAAASRMVGGAR